MTETDSIEALARGHAAADENRRSRIMSRS